MQCTLATHTKVCCRMSTLKWTCYQNLASLFSIHMFNNKFNKRCPKSSIWNYVFPHIQITQGQCVINYFLSLPTWKFLNSIHFQFWLSLLICHIILFCSEMFGVSFSVFLILCTFSYDMLCSFEKIITSSCI